MPMKEDVFNDLCLVINMWKIETPKTSANATFYL